MCECECVWVCVVYRNIVIDNTHVRHIADRIITPRATIGCVAAQTAVVARRYSEMLAQGRVLAAVQACTVLAVFWTRRRWTSILAIKAVVTRRQALVGDLFRGKC